MVDSAPSETDRHIDMQHAPSDASRLPDSPHSTHQEVAPMIARSKFFGLIAASALALVSGIAQAAYPERPITMVVPWGAGGGTDATARIIGSLLEKELGQPVNVVNRTGGSGVVGHQAIAAGTPDGYTIGLATVEIGMMHWQGLTELSGTSYTPIGLVNADPASINVRAD